MELTRRIQKFNDIIDLCTHGEQKSITECSIGQTSRWSGYSREDHIRVHWCQLRAESDAIVGSDAVIRLFITLYVSTAASRMKWRSYDAGAGKH